nr:14347_t:CDS:2 [Entrophospora candida]
MDHLTKEHSNILSTTNQLQKPYKENDNKRIKECTDAVINFIVGFQMPFSVVGNFWFKKLCNIFDSWYILPTHQSLQNQIYQIFENHHNLIAKELSELTVKVPIDMYEKTQKLIKEVTKLSGFVVKT